MASLSLCNISDIEVDPKTLHHAGCYVFLELPPLTKDCSKNSASFCTNCTERSHLMRVFNEVKHSSRAILDLTSPEVNTTLMPIGSFDRNNVQNDGACMEPTDLSVKRMTVTMVATKSVEIAPQTSPRIQPPGAKHRATGVETVSNCVGSQTCEKFVKTTVSKAETMLGKVMRTEPIKRKHKGPSRQLYLINKVQQIENRFLALKKHQELPEDTSQRSKSQSDLPVKAKVSSNSAPQQQKQPPAASQTRNFVILKNPDGSNAIVPAIAMHSAAKDTLLAFTSAAYNETAEEKLYKCLDQGCTESFNNKSSLSRHRKKVHFPNKLHKCNNCGHGFPRRYMLRRHLEHKVCLPKELSKWTPTTLVGS